MPKKTRAQKIKAQQRKLAIHIEEKNNRQIAQPSSPSIINPVVPASQPIRENNIPNQTHTVLSQYFTRDLLKSVIVSVAIISLIIILKLTAK